LGKRSLPLAVDHVKNKLNDVKETEKS